MKEFLEEITKINIPSKEIENIKLHTNTESLYLILSLEEIIDQFKKWMSE